MLSKTYPMTRYRVAFIPRNNLDSKTTPIFRPQTPRSSTDHKDSHLSTSFYSTKGLSPHLPVQRRRSGSLTSTKKFGRKTLSELGDSSPLFSLQGPPDDHPDRTPSPCLVDQNPIRLELGSLDKRRQL
jgi:hypothetical protein